MPLLNNGDAFPKLSVAVVGGGTIALPAALAGSWAVVLTIAARGARSATPSSPASPPRRRRSTASASRSWRLSVDDEATSAATKAKNHLQFPVGHSADADAVAAATGAFVNASPHFLQPAGFVLGPDGTVKAAAYATSAIGRVVAKDVVGFVGYLQSVAAKAAAE